MSMRFDGTRPVPRLDIDVSHVDDPESPRFSHTQQSFKEECDINTIMKRFERTGVFEHFAQYKGDYGDFLEVPQSYHDAVNQVLAADAMFMSLPAKVRARFNNDAGLFLSFVDDPRNGDELVQLGLAVERVNDADSELAESRAPGAPGGDQAS